MVKAERSRSHVPLFHSTVPALLGLTRLYALWLQTCSLPSIRIQWLLNVSADLNSNGCVFYITNRHKHHVGRKMANALLSLWTFITDKRDERDTTALPWVANQRPPSCQRHVLQSAQLAWKSSGSHPRWKGKEAASSRDKSSGAGPVWWERGSS